MTGPLSGKRIAFLATDGVEQSELTRPWETLRQAGASVSLIALEPGTIQGVNHDEKGASFAVDATLADTTAADFDGLVLPGGVMNPDALRVHAGAVAFVADFFARDKPVAAICHAPWLLIEADVVRGRRVTSWPSVKTDLLNAGAAWVDEDCVRDNKLVTSRKPADLDVFCTAICALFEGRLSEK